MKKTEVYEECFRICAILMLPSGFLRYKWYILIIDYSPMDNDHMARLFFLNHKIQIFWDNI